MAIDVADLWPADITPNVLSPLAILRAQASALDRKTKGLIRGMITSREKEKRITHYFGLMAPALDRYRERIFLVDHDKSRVYPVVVEADCFIEKQRPFNDYTELQENQDVATTQEEFVRLIREVLQSAAVRSSIQSLIARSNELQEPAYPAEDQESGGSADTPPNT